MKRLGVAAIIGCKDKEYHLLMGRRGKDPNRGLFVLPGGGVQDGESLEQAWRREIMEETGLELEDNPNRWCMPFLIELDDRIILVASGIVKGNSTPKDGSDLYEVGWHPVRGLPPDISPVVWPVLDTLGFVIKSIDLITGRGK